MEIHEYTDFRCSHFSRAHMMVSKLVARYADRICVYHRHLPLADSTTRCWIVPFIHGKIPDEALTVLNAAAP